MLTHFANQLRSKHVLLLIDSEAVEGALIKGYSGTEDVCELVGLFWDLAAKLRCLIYIDRVPTDANPADYPSRNKMEIGQGLGWPFRSRRSSVIRSLSEWNQRLTARAEPRAKRTYQLEHNLSRTPK